MNFHDILLYFSFNNLFSVFPSLICIFLMTSPLFFCIGKLNKIILRKKKAPRKLQKSSNEPKL